MVTATKVIGEHSHPHSAGWEGSLNGEMKKMGIRLYMAPSSDWIRKDAPKLQQPPLSPAHSRGSGGRVLLELAGSRMLPGKK